MDFEKLIQNNGIENINNSIEVLKNNGFSQMQSVKFLVVNLKLSIPTIDDLVINSSAWKFERDKTIEFRKKVDEILSKLSKKGFSKKI